MPVDPRTGQTVIDPITASLLRASQQPAPNAPGGFLGPIASAAAARYRQRKAEERQQEEIAKREEMINAQLEALSGEDPTAQRAAIIRLVGAGVPPQVLSSMLPKGTEFKHVPDVGLVAIPSSGPPTVAIPTPDKLSAIERRIRRAFPDDPEAQAVMRRRLLEAEAEGKGVSVSVRNEGNIPQGSRAVRDESGNIVRIEPIPGGTQPTAAERSDEVDSELALQTISELERLMAGRFEIEEGTGGLPVPKVGPGADLSRFLSGNLPFSDLSEQDAELISLTETLSNAITAALRGSQVGPAEQEKIERQLPRPDQKPSLFFSNLRRSKRNLQFLQKARRSARNEPEDLTSLTDEQLREIAGKGR